MFESWPELWGGGYSAYRTTLRKFLWFRTVTGGNAPEYDTVIGRIVSFITQRIAPLKIEATLAPIQEGTGDPSPENIRPISGHTGAEVYVTGKNLLKLPTYAELITYPVKSGYYGVPIKLEPSTAYYLSTTFLNGYSPIGENIYALVSIAFPVTTWKAVAHSTQGAVDGTLTTGADGYLYLCVNTATTEAKWNALLQNVQTQLEYGSTASAYEPYSGTTVTVNFGQTVYSGTLTVNEDGTGTVKARPYYASYNGETLVGPWVSSMDAYAPGTTPTTGAQVVDMGGTETTIPLTPGQVNALQGNNTVWVDDSGEIKVTYRSN